MEDIRKKLFKLQDLKYKKFHSSLCPNVDNIIGVRIPELRKIAKEISKENSKEFLKCVKDEYYEELVLHGLVIGYSKISIEETFKYLKQFVPKIDSWAVCDVTCSNLKITKRYQEEMWNFLENYITSDKEFEIRFAVVMYLNYYLTEDYIDQVLEKIDKITVHQYYVQMGIAWLISFAYIKQKEKTIKFIENNHLDQFTHNKSIQKICESYRVTPEEKENLKKYKIIDKPSVNKA